MSEEVSEQRSDLHSVELELEKIKGELRASVESLKTFAADRAHTARNQAIGVLAFVALLSGLGVFASISPLVKSGVIAQAVAAAKSAQEDIKEIARTSEGRIQSSIAASMERLSEARDDLVRELELIEQENSAVVEDFLRDIRSEAESSSQGIEELHLDAISQMNEIRALMEQVEGIAEETEQQIVDATDETVRQLAEETERFRQSAEVAAEAAMAAQSQIGESNLAALQEAQIGLTAELISLRAEVEFLNKSVQPVQVPEGFEPIMPPISSGGLSVAVRNTLNERIGTATRLSPLGLHVRLGMHQDLSPKAVILPIGSFVFANDTRNSVRVFFTSLMIAELSSLPSFAE